MCTNPLHIRLKKYRCYGIGTSIQVPCGKCYECLHKRASSIYTRARVEYEECLKAGGNGFMCCLTYSDDLVPTLVIDGKRYMVFNKRDVILFIKRLRTNLQRHYKKNLGVNAPFFKYLVTSEYGTEEGKTHRPHYHLLFFFREPCSFTAFRTCFTLSLQNRKRGSGVYCFGYIKQCDIIDRTRGGIKYSAKYVCKDIMYEYQRDYIEKLIRYKQDVINQRFGIYSDDENDFLKILHNKLIRASKSYKKAVENEVRHYRYMLQFYMLSNDLGGSAYLERYGDYVLDMPVINFDGFEYSIPSQFVTKITQKYGLEGLSKLRHNVFLNFTKKMLSAAQVAGRICKDEANDLYAFAEKYVQPHEGTLRLVYRNFDEVFSYDAEWDELFQRFKFFIDNDFYRILDELNKLFRWYGNDDNLMFRCMRAYERAKREHEEYINKKRNKYGNNF